MSNAIWRLSWVLLLVLLFIVTAHGAVIVPPQTQDDLNLQVTETVTFDANFGLYTYEYSIKSRKNSRQSVWLFAIDTLGEITNVSSPPGWRSNIPEIFSTRGRQLQWTTGGRTTEGANTIKAGETLTGFSIQSPAAPGTSTGYVQGWAPLPEADDPEGIAAAGYDLTLFDSNKNCVQVPVQAPKSQCNDGVDNDNDGLIDMADPGCAEPSDRSEGVDCSAPIGAYSRRTGQMERGCQRPESRSGCLIFPPLN